ncbi:MAG: hypothetical protein RL754_283 [Bacteroidota bacterium]|jgi:hypothetical protein
MRVVETWHTKQYKTTIYAMERWHYVEFEAGPMKQGYKFMKDTHPSVADIKDALTPAFQEAIYKHFEAMYLSFKEHTK